MAELTERVENKNKYGLSRKTNIAMVAVTAIGMAKDSIPAILAISFVASLAITYQFIMVRPMKSSWIRSHSTK